MPGIHPAEAKDDTWGKKQTAAQAECSVSLEMPPSTMGACRNSGK